MNQAAKLLSVQLVAMFAALLSIDVSVQCFEKIASQLAGDSIGNELKFYLHLLQLPWTWAVVILSLLQLWVWMKILSKTDLSVAYPISSLCFPLTMVASIVFFHEHVSFGAWLGAFLIASGIALVGGENHEVADKHYLATDGTYE